MIMKKLIPIAILIITLTIAGLYTKNVDKTCSSGGGIAVQDNGLLIVRNLCVGDADSALIQHNGKIGIIDTGTKDSYDDIAASIDQTGAGEISFMILTHYDKDHIGSALKIIENYDIETIFIPDYVSKKKKYEPLMKGIAELTNVQTLSENTTYTWDDVNIEIIVADDDSYLEDDSTVDNNESLVCMMSYGANRLLFTGDIEKKRINKLIESGIDLSCDYIKIPHHGKDTKQAIKLARYTTPEYAVISTSSDIDKAVDTANALTEAGVETFNTSDGEIITIANGITVSSEYADSYDNITISESIEGDEGITPGMWRACAELCEQTKGR